MLSKRGSGFLSIVLASALVVGSFLYYARNSRTSRVTATSPKETVLAEVMAGELLEFFRSLTTTQLVQYLNRNPFYPGAAACTGCGAACPPTCNPYYLCAHINLLDRTATPNRILNEDPIAELAPSFLDSATAGRAANRFYRVEVVDLTTLQTNKTYCNNRTTQDLLDGSGNLIAMGNNRLQVTVGVSWYPGTSTNAKRVVLSTILPTVP